MPITPVTVSYDVADILGVDFDATRNRTSVYVSTNVPDDVIVDTDSNQIRLDGGRGSVNTDGTGSVSLWPTNAATNPTAFQYYFTIDYIPRGSGGHVKKELGPFSVTADANLADLVEEQAVPPTYLTTVTTLLDGYVTEASGFADDAETSAAASEQARLDAEALVLSDLGTTDGQTRALIENPASQTAVALSTTQGEQLETPGTPANVAAKALIADEGTELFSKRGTINRARRKLAQDPANFRVLILGDSSAEIDNYAATYDYLRNRFTLPGMPLEGVNPTHIVEGGNSGVTVQAWNAGGAGAYSTTVFEADNTAQPFDLIIDFFAGLNDVARDGHSQATFVADKRAQYAYLHSVAPQADVLVVTAAVLTTTVVSTDFLPGLTRAQVQARNDTARKALLSLRDEYPWVEILDAQAELFGTIVYATHPHKQDQLHYNTSGQRGVARLIALTLGRDRTWGANPAAGPQVSAPQRLPFLVASGGVGYMRLTRLNTFDINAADAGITAADTLYLPGTATPVSLATLAPTRQVNGDLQINLSGGTDYTAYVGGLALVVSDRPGPGVAGGRHRVTVAPAADIAAGAYADVAVSVPGALYEGGVIPNPRGALPAGIAIAGCWCSAADTVVVRLHNITGSSITIASATVSMYFWLAR